jgi:hypothetical protein
VAAMQGSTEQRRPVFMLSLRPESGVADPTYALKRALKVLQRRFGLRALSVRECGEDEQ